MAKATTPPKRATKLEEEEPDEGGRKRAARMDEVKDYVTDEQITRTELRFTELRAKVVKQRPLHPGPTLIEVAEAVAKDVQAPADWGDIEGALDYGEKMTREAKTKTGHERTSRIHQAWHWARWCDARIEEIVSRESMKQFTKAIRRALETENYVAALAVGLMLPDLAGWVDTGQARGKSKERYSTWWDNQMAECYPSLRHDETTTLTGKDCYALRCAYLHQGLDDTSDHDHEVLQRFEFTAGVPAHGNRRRTPDGHEVLQVDVGLFCGELAQRFEAWFDNVTDSAAIARSRTVLTILDTHPLGEDPLGIGKPVRFE